MYFSKQPAERRELSVERSDSERVVGDADNV